MARLAGTSGKPGPLARLTPHERSVLKLIGEGRANRQIGERMFLAEKTMKNYVSTLSGKLGRKQHPQAAAYAARILAAATLQSSPDMTITGRKP
jgi:DNA-binding NarL/FixJ family response regulator